MIENPVGRKIHWPRIAKIFSLKADISNGEPHMRITRLIFVGSIGVLAALMAPALAKNASLNSHASANAQKPERAADGTGLPRLPAGSGWIMGPAFLPGGRPDRAGASARQVCDKNPGPRDTLKQATAAPALSGSFGLPISSQGIGPFKNPLHQLRRS
jgi:hypothetical protein